MAQRVKRKLAAILAAAVVGYSRLVGADEAGTIARLKALRKELIEPLIAEYHGRVVKLTRGVSLHAISASQSAEAGSRDRRHGEARRSASAIDPKAGVFSRAGRITRISSH
jgi:class 3 adenylate cyclase